MDQFEELINEFEGKFGELKVRLGLSWGVRTY